jgi:hypothetical protein
LDSESIEYSSLSPDVFTTVELEKSDGTVLIAKVIEGSVDKGSLTGTVSLESSDGEVIEANVVNIGTKSILEDIDGDELIAKLGIQWILPNHFSEETMDYISTTTSSEIEISEEIIEELSERLDLEEQVTESILTGEQILTQLGNQWLLVDDLSGEITTYISDEIAEAIGNIDLSGTTISDGSVLEAHLASGSISGSKIQNGVVMVSHLASNSVSTAKIVDDNVTLIKLAGDSVDSSKIVNGSIINEDISNSANIDWDKINKTGSLLTEIGDRKSEYLSAVDAGGYFTGSDVETILQELANGTALDSRYLQSFTELDPTLASWIGTSNIITLGTITSGVWNGTPISSTYIEDGTITFADLSQNGCTDGQIMEWNETGGTWVCASQGGSGVPIKYEFVHGSYDTSTTSTSFVDMPEMNISIETSGNPIEVIFSSGVGHSVNLGITRYALYIDDVQVDESKIRTGNASMGPDVTITWLHTPAAGIHEYKVMWLTESGTAYNRINVESRTLTVKEFVGTSVSGLLDCPTGMIPVPATNGANSFCVDKYEAKQSGSVAVSQASVAPWVSIKQYDARSACILAGKHLITEQEWLQIAQDVEQVGWNWDGGVVGTNYMSDGNSDGSPGSALAADVTGDPDDDPCVGTGQACDLMTWNSQRRTYQLSNGEYIWDFGGNVWNWTDSVTHNDYPIPNLWSAWISCANPDGVCGNREVTNDQKYGGNTIAMRGYIRGGDWYESAKSGAFSLSLQRAVSNTVTNLGFRCAQ